MTNPRRRREREQWTRECLERWKAAHPPIEQKEKKR